MNKLELMITNKDKLYSTTLVDEVTWETWRKNSPGKLSFKVVKDDIISFTEGDSVKVSVDDQPIFHGYVFSKSRDTGGTIDVVAYDQLRYLKNKDTIIFEEVTASEMIKKIAADCYLRCGEIADTEYTLESRTEDNKTLFDMIQSALDITVYHTDKLYVLYDDCGNLTLKDAATMRTDFLINEKSGEDLSYTSSIDSNTYNRIKLGYENDKTGKREIYEARDSGHIEDWGLLQTYKSVQNTVNVIELANTMLALYNQKSRSLSVKNMIGDLRLKAGTSPMVHLQLGDIEVNKYMVCEQVRHTFSDNQHLMTATLIGGEFLA